MRFFLCVFCLTLALASSAFAQSVTLGGSSSTLTPAEWNYIYLAMASIAGALAHHFNAYPLVSQALNKIFPDLTTPPATVAQPASSPSMGAASATAGAPTDPTTAILAKIVNHPNMTQAQKSAATAAVISASSVTAPPAA